MMNSYCINVIFHLSPQLSSHLKLLQVECNLCLPVKTIKMFQLCRVDQRLYEALIVTTHLVMQLLLTFANSTGPHDPTESVDRTCIKWKMMNLSTQTYTHMHTHIHTHTHTHTHTHKYTYTHMYTHAHTHTHMHVRTHAHTHARTHIRIHACTHTCHMHVRTHTRTCVHTYTHYLSLTNRRYPGVTKCYTFKIASYPFILYSLTNITHQSQTLSHYNTLLTLNNPQLNSPALHSLPYIAGPQMQTPSFHHTTHKIWRMVHPKGVYHRLPITVFAQTYIVVVSCIEFVKGCQQISSNFWYIGSQQVFPLYITVTCSNWIVHKQQISWLQLSTNNTIIKLDWQVVTVVPMWFVVAEGWYLKVRSLQSFQNQSKMLQGLPTEAHIHTKP